MPFANSRVTVDVVLLKALKAKSSEIKDYEILLIERGHPPYAGAFALPGGFLDEDDETLARAAVRELVEETAVLASAEELINLGGYGDIGRDPRGRTVTVAFALIVDEARATSAKAGDDARNLEFFNLQNLPALAFDHAKIIADALKRLALS